MSLPDPTQEHAMHPYSLPLHRAHRPTGRTAALVLVLTAALAGCQSGSGPAEPDTGTGATTAAGPASGQQTQQAPRNAVHSPAIDWVALQSHVGAYPHDVPYLQEAGLRARLQQLLGTAYPVALLNLQVAAPLQAEHGVLFVTGNRAHMGGEEAVAIALEPESDSIRVWLLHQGQQQVFEEPQADFAWPTDIRTLITNTSSQPR
ncbi:hypothetical protein D8I35_11570 [Corticibacter populi]|uniref:Uncharacterized protein n=1 Tax=Corticibacter populi TaxID=1550736 RepID=A0A3M6QS36_9BURK|nr:hypothetical protein [Corticibacter populi]RMX05793.1 hypothetical protein D8I35_11570 [Corticibacter populi]RZS30897.1 hypothetical protein EV687_3095 [Corticibacter populi]